MEPIQFYRPKLEEMAFRQKLLGDPETMAYNHAYGGVIPFPRERWADWYARWVAEGDGARFYRYLRDAETMEWVGEASYHYDEAFQAFLCDILIAATCRGRGYGSAGLRLLCGAAKANGVRELRDNIAVDNPALGLFKRAGFAEAGRTDEYILVAKAL